jgi:hypothetical protein
MMQRNARNQGAILIVALIFLSIVAAMAATMGFVSQGNLHNATTYERSQRALATAETGMDFIAFRMNEIAGEMGTDRGDISGAVADDLWAMLSWRLYSELAAESQFQQSADYPNLLYDQYGRPRCVELGHVVVDRNQSDTTEPAATFQVTVQQHPLMNDSGVIDATIYDQSYYQREPYSIAGGDNEFTFDGEAVSSVNPITNDWIRVTVTGHYEGVERPVQMDFCMKKTTRYAIISRNRIMIGRNVIIDGAIGSRYTDTQYLHGHPVQLRDNFHGLDLVLDGQLDSLTSYLSTHDMDGDNRINMADPRETSDLGVTTFTDHDGNGYIDTFDLFMGQYDDNSDGSVSMSEFQDGGNMVDPQLWKLVNEYKYPAGTDFSWNEPGFDWSTDTPQVRLPGQDWVEMTDLTRIDIEDGYAKIHGKIMMSSTEAAWESGAANGPYQQYYRGPVDAGPYDAATTFQTPDSQMGTFAPTDFDVSEYRSMASGDFAAQASAAVPNDDTKPANYIPPSTETIESIPYNSPYPYDYYQRPVYENMVFENVTIPRGTNALFKNCKFVGVTFVDTETGNTDPNFNYAGMQNADGSNTYSGITAQVDGEEVTDTKQLSNNLRFESCDFEGVVVSETPESFTHVRNKVQFTGETRFDIEADGLTAEQKALFRRSTILTPQFSVDMGTFTDPTSSGEVTRLEGAIVAGVLDVRGQARIDGSIISTFEPQAGAGPLAEGGNPAAFNTTIGYFESTAGDSEAEVPDGGHGKIIIRHDPHRPLPDGIMGSIHLDPALQTYFEEGGR